MKPLKSLLICFLIVGLYFSNGCVLFGSGHGNPGHVLEEYPLYPVTEEQTADFKFMWEEEKLAKDIYTYFAEKYGSRIFKNISRSEQRHQSAMKALLDRYQVKVNEDLSAGEFENPELQKLYTQLIAKGNQSLQDALEVGKAIEIKDIKDLEEAIKTANPDAKAIYNRLLQASKRHLAAFNRHLG